MLADGWKALFCGLHIRTAAATASQLERNRGGGGAGGEERLSVRSAGGYDSITFSRQPDGGLGGETVRRARSQRHGVATSCADPATCSSEGRAGGRLGPHRWEVNANVACLCPVPTHPSSSLSGYWNKTRRITVNYSKIPMIHRNEPDHWLYKLGRQVYICVL